MRNGCASSLGANLAAPLPECGTFVGEKGEGLMPGDVRVGPRPPTVSTDVFQQRAIKTLWLDP